jgi:hypothetical protein
MILLVGLGKDVTNRFVIVVGCNVAGLAMFQKLLVSTFHYAGPLG